MLPIILRGATALNRANTVRKALSGGSGGGNRNIGGTGGTGRRNQTSSMTVRPKTSLIPSSNISINFSSGSGGSRTSNAKTNGLEKNVRLIKITVISIDRIIKSNFILEQQAEKSRIRREEVLQRNKRESDLESKKKSVDLTGNKERKVRVPGQGLLGGILDFFVNMFLGWATLKLLKHIPTITKILKPLASAVDFFIDFSGKILNGLVTFIDWGVKLYDWSRSGVGKIFGDNGLKVFDGFINTITTVMNLAILAMMAGINPLDPFGRGKSKGGPKPRPGRGGRPKVTTSGGGGAGRPNIRNPLRNRPTVTQGGKQGGFRFPGTGPKVTGGSQQLPKVPKGIKNLKGLKSSGLLGLLLLIPTMFEVGGLFQQGYRKTAINVIISTLAGISAGSAAASAVVAGAGALGLTGIGIPAAIALALSSLVAGGVAGWAAYEASYNTLKAFGLRDDDPELKKQGYSSGGEVGKSKKKQSKKDISYVEPRYKPVEFDAKNNEFFGGVEYKLENGVMTKVDAPEQQQKTSKHLKDSIREYGSTDYLGPMFNLYSKSLLGKKPTEYDYREAGQGVNAWFANALNSGDLSLADILVKKQFDLTTWSTSSLKDIVGGSSKRTASSYSERQRMFSTITGEASPFMGGAVTGGGTYSGSATGAGILRNDPAFVQAVNELAVRLGVNPAEMLGFMEIETAGTFSPSIDNGLGYVGLIQFGPEARQDLGVTKEQLQSMSRIEQLKWVEKYFMNVNKMAGKSVFRPGGGAKASDLYTAVFLPAYVGADDSTVFPQWAWAGNPALRDSSRPGSPIWKGHIGKLVQQRAQKYGASGITFTPTEMTAGGVTPYGGVDLSGVQQGNPAEAAKRLLADFPQIKSRGNNSQIFAAGLGYWLKKNFVPPAKDAHRAGRGDLGDPAGGDMEHPDHGGVVASHRGKGHYQGKALDLGGMGAGAGGAYAGDQKYMWPYIAKFLKIYGLDKEPYVPQVIFSQGENFSPRKMGVIGPDSGHNDHIHIEFHRGGFVPGLSGREIASKLLPKEFVVDVDSARAIEESFPGLLMAVNQASNREGIIKAVSEYTSVNSPQLLVYKEQVTDTVYLDKGSSSSMSEGSATSSNVDYFGILDRLPG